MKTNLRAWIENLAGGQPYGIIIIHEGAVAAEWYGNGFGPDSLFEIGSIRKSFNSALIGQGLERGRIDLQKRASEVWPDIIRLGDPAKDAMISLHHLASGVSGWLASEPPGTTFRYNNAAFTAAERVTARMLGLARDEIAPEVSRQFKSALNAESWRCYHFEREFTPGDRDNPGAKLAIDSNLRDLAAWESRASRAAGAKTGAAALAQSAPRKIRDAATMAMGQLRRSAAVRALRARALRRSGFRRDGGASRSRAARPG